MVLLVVIQRICTIFDIGLAYLAVHLSIPAFAYLNYMAEVNCLCNFFYKMQSCRSTVLKLSKFFITIFYVLMRTNWITLSMKV